MFKLHHENYHFVICSKHLFQGFFFKTEIKIEIIEIFLLADLYMDSYMLDKSGTLNAYKIN